MKIVIAIKQDIAHMLKNHDGLCTDNEQERNEIADMTAHRVMALYTVRRKKFTGKPHEFTESDAAMEIES